MRIAAGLVVVLAVAGLGAAYAVTRDDGARPELTGVQLFDRCVAATQRRIQRSLPAERRRLLAALREVEATDTPRLARLHRRSVHQALQQMRQPGYASRSAWYVCSGGDAVVGVGVPS